MGSDSATIPPGDEVMVLQRRANRRLSMHLRVQAQPPVQSILVNRYASARVLHKAVAPKPRHEMGDNFAGRPDILRKQFVG